MARLIAKDRTNYFGCYSSDEIEVDSESETIALAALSFASLLGLAVFSWGARWYHLLFRYPGIQSDLY